MSRKTQQTNTQNTRAQNENSGSKKRLIKSSSKERAQKRIMNYCSSFILVAVVSVACGIFTIKWELDSFITNLIFEGGNTTVQRLINQVSPSDQTKLNRSVERGIDRRSNLSLEEFINIYDAKWPVVITDAMKYWPAMKKWNKEYFINKYRDELITFKAVKGKLPDGESLSAPVKIFLKHIHTGSPDVWTYLQDEIFILNHKELRSDFDSPIYLKEDFFSLLPEEIRPWNAMLLWGTKYSRSSLHIDPYNWTGTNAVIKGKKAWKLYPPGQDHLLYANGKSLSGFPLECYKYGSQIDTFDVDERRYPNFKKAKAIEFVQQPGELLIIPTGWFHQAYNQEETLAISSQVMNSQNYKKVLHEILKLGNIEQKDMPKNNDELEPKEQVQNVFANIPKNIIDKGRKVTQDIFKQLHYKSNTKLYF